MRRRKLSLYRVTATDKFTNENYAESTVIYCMAASIEDAIREATTAFAEFVIANSAAKGAGKSYSDIDPNTTFEAANTEAFPSGVIIETGYDT